MGSTPTSSSPIAPSTWRRASGSTTSHRESWLGSAREPAHARPPSRGPKHLAEKILTSKNSLDGERKQVTVLFADLKGSVSLLLLDDDAPLSVREDAIASTVLTRRQVVSLALLGRTDDLPARQALQGNHRRQILQDCRTLLSHHGARDERRRDTHQGPAFRTRGHSDAPPSS